MSNNNLKSALGVVSGFAYVEITCTGDVWDIRAYRSVKDYLTLYSDYANSTSEAPVFTVKVDTSKEISDEQNSNKENKWIRTKGKNPFSRHLSEGNVIDIQFRDGRITKFLDYPDSCGYSWELRGDDSDIVQYRISKTNNK